MRDDAPILISTTSDDRDVLVAIAKEATRRKLAACCQLGAPIESHYCWEGKQQASMEHPCTLKTLAHRFDDLSMMIRQMHNYDVPQIVATQLSHLDPDFEIWMRQQIQPENDTE